jgi:hypothetical protein
MLPDMSSHAGLNRFVARYSRKGVVTPLFVVPDQVSLVPLATAAIPCSLKTYAAFVGSVPARYSAQVFIPSPSGSPSSASAKSLVKP